MIGAYEEDGDCAGRAMRSRLDPRVWIADIVGDEHCFEHAGGLRAVRRWVEEQVARYGRDVDEVLSWKRDDAGSWVYSTTPASARSQDGAGT